MAKPGRVCRGGRQGGQHCWVAVGGDRSGRELLGEVERSAEDLQQLQLGQSGGGLVFQALGPLMVSATLSKSWSMVRATAMSGALTVVGVPTAPSRS
jgi:hypothetical protein